MYAYDKMFGVNTKGRPIHRGPRGGFYVIQDGKKIYKFKRGSPATAFSGGGKLTSPMKARLLKLADAIKRRRIPNFKGVKGFIYKTLIFKKFENITPTVKGYNYTDKRISVGFLDENTNNSIMGVRETDLPLQSWLDAQSQYIANLNTYDFYTAMAYTVRSHQWIGPWLRGEKRVTFTTPSGFTLPLFPQVKKLVDENPKLWENFSNAFNQYSYYSRTINSMPRDLMEKALKLYTSDLQRIIKKAPALPRTMYVYRGISRDIFKGKMGAVHTLGEFASTAYVPQRGYGPARYMRIKLLKGSKVLLLQGLNKWDQNGEFEVLLNKGARYIIRKRNLLRPVINSTYINSYLKKYVTDITLIS